MYQYLDYLKNPLIAGLVGASFIVLVAYIDKHMNHRDFENNYFYKVFIGVFILVAGLVYFAKSGTTNVKQIGGNISSGEEHLTTVVKKLGSTGSNYSGGYSGGNGSEIYTDIPDF